MCKGRLHRYLERSVAAPLSVEITLKADYWPPRNKDSMARIQSLIKIISQELSRWESLLIDFADEERLDKWTRRAWKHEPIILLESILLSPMPSLRRLSLCGVREYFEDFFFPHVPSLNAFESKGGSTNHLNIPWSSLTAFWYSSNQYSNDSQKLFQLPQCVRLKDLYIEGVQPDTTELRTAFNCSLPNVVSFQLICLPSWEPINIILANFRLPSLQNLTLVVPHAFWDRSQDPDFPPYMMMAEMSTAEHIAGFAGTCKVLTLVWRETLPYHRWAARCVTSRSVIFDMFNAMPDLEELRLSEEISDVFLKVIKEEETLVPKLSRVFIAGTGGLRVPLKLDGIASRWQKDENRKTKEVPSRYVLC